MRTAARSPWWADLDPQALRHVRTALDRRGLVLTVVEQRTDEAVAFAPLSEERPAGAGLAAIARGAADQDLAAIDLAAVEAMLRQAVLDLGAKGPGRARQEERPRPDAVPGARTSYRGIFGAAPAMQELYDLLERIAPSDSTVLIQGENGTGKELVARAIHEGSPRRDRRFIVTNCSAFNDNLLDSELFGHRRGAFTGAVTDKPGLFEVADNGTFFLDEIGDMSPALQVKVLRVLQEGTFTRVGDTETRKVDVRIISATNRDLTGMVASGRFREDLYYRIHVLHVQLPALRERREDIPLLIDQFLSRQRRGGKKRLAPACAAQLYAYPWPGNVRELENEIERLVVLSDDAPAISADLLSARIRQWTPAPEPAREPETGSLPAAIEALERRMIGAAMRRHNGNKTRAAEDLKVSRRNLIRLVQKYQLEK